MRVPSLISSGGARRRRVRTAAAVAGAVLGAYAAGWALLCTPAAQARLRARVLDALRARLGAEVALEGDVRVDPLLRVSFGPLVVRDAGRRGAPFLRVERVTARPRLAALLAGRVEPASLELAGARVALGRPVPGAAALVSPAPREIDVPLAGEGRPARDLAVRLHRLVVVATLDGEPLELGPVDGEIRVEQDAAGDRATLDVRLPGGGRAVADARRAPGDGWRGRVTASGLGPALVPPPLRDAAVRVEGASISIAAEGAVAPDLSSAEGHVRVAAAGVVLEGARIGPAPMGPLQAEAEGTLGWNGRDRHLTLSGGRVSLLGAIHADAEGELGLVRGHPFLFSVRADGVDYASAVAALPPSLAPLPSVPRPAGTLDARATISGPLLAPSDWTLSTTLDLSRMRARARAAPPVALRSPFVHRPVLDGAARAITVGPANPDFVPVGDLPVHVIRAVTTSEDGGFFGHEGFDFDELRNALAEDAAAGRAVRGGSTITQQLAKNLYLSGEKTLTRKVREAVITIALEATIPKQRLLEIYLNIVEWGPGVYGIGPAARYWFGKDARDLGPYEAAVLAAMIPNPNRYLLARDRGEISDALRRRAEDVLLKMTEQGVLGRQDLARALAEPIVFTRG